MASIAEQLATFLLADSPLQAVAPGGVWTYALSRKNDAQMALAFNPDTGHPRTSLVIRERSPRPDNLAVGPADSKHVMDSIWKTIDIYIYTHAVDSGKTAGRQAMYRLKTLLDGYRFTTEIGFLATMRWAGEGTGWIDSEDFERTVYDYCSYRVRTRLS